MQRALPFLFLAFAMCLHTPADARPGSVRGIALECEELFPTKDWRVNRELALVLTYLRRDNTLGPDDGVTPKIIQALLDARCHGVVAITEGVTAVGARKGVEDRGRHPGRIVAREVHGASPCERDERYLHTRRAEGTHSRCAARAIHGPLVAPRVPPGK